MSLTGVTGEGSVSKADFLQGVNSPSLPPTLLLTPPTSNRYFQKLPALSPRSAKKFITSCTSSPDLRKSSPTRFLTATSTGSNESSSSESFSDNHSDDVASNTDDINFFLQVVGVFRDYVTDQIEVLESQLAENQTQLAIFENERKKIEIEAENHENQLSRDIAHLVGLLHQKELQLKDSLKKQNCDVISSVRNRGEQCRKNIRIISGVLIFAKRIRNESGESLKENTVRELKQRLDATNELMTPELPLLSKEHLRGINGDISVVNLIESIALLAPQKGEEARQHGGSSKKGSTLIIMAALSDGDITSNSITVRWQSSQTKDGIFEVQWNFVSQLNSMEMRSNCTKHCYVISDLPPNCDIKVKVRQINEASEWSRSALFRTRPLPVNFSLDANTAHVKLKFSPDYNTVFYGGEESVNSISKSTDRFTFALNVLGNISFSCGRHYWEFNVNCDGWAAGVAYRGVPRNSWLGSNDSSWILHYNAAREEYKVRHAGEAAEIKPQFSNSEHFLKRLGVLLDCDAGLISFVDPINTNLLFTYTVTHFREPLSAAVNPFYHRSAVTLLTGLEIPDFLCHASSE